MPVEPIGGSRPVDPIKPVAPKKIEKLPSQDKFDKADISNVGRLISEIRKLPDVREEKIEEIRKAIAKGDFDNPERVARSVEDILNSLREAE